MPRLRGQTWRGAGVPFPLVAPMLSGGGGLAAGVGCAAAGRRARLEKHLVDPGTQENAVRAYAYVRYTGLETCSVPGTGIVIYFNNNNLYHGNVVMRTDQSRSSYAYSYREWVCPISLPLPDIWYPLLLLLSIVFLSSSL